MLDANLNFCCIVYAFDLGMTDFRLRARIGVPEIVCKAYVLSESASYFFVSPIITTERSNINTKG